MPELHQRPLYLGRAVSEPPTEMLCNSPSVLNLDTHFFSWLSEGRATVSRLMFYFQVCLDGLDTASIVARRVLSVA